MKRRNKIKSTVNDLDNNYVHSNRSDMKRKKSKIKREKENKKKIKGK